MTLSEVGSSEFWVGADRPPPANNTVKRQERPVFWGDYRHFASPGLSFVLKTHPSSEWKQRQPPKSQNTPEVMKALRDEGLDLTVNRLRYAIIAGKIERPPMDGAQNFNFAQEHIQQLRDYLRNPPRRGSEASGSRSIDANVNLADLSDEDAKEEWTAEPAPV